MLCDDMRPFTRPPNVCKHGLCLQADVGAVVLLSPRTFAGKAKQAPTGFTETGYKAQQAVNKCAVSAFNS